MIENYHDVLQWVVINLAHLKFAKNMGTIVLMNLCTFPHSNIIYIFNAFGRKPILIPTDTEIPPVRAILMTNQEGALVSSCHGSDRCLVASKLTEVFDQLGDPSVG
ncbi:TPA: hypothetical protein ACOJM5_004579, partial [Pseudomonas putida]